MPLCVPLSKLSHRCIYLLPPCAAVPPWPGVQFVRSCRAKIKSSKGPARDKHTHTHTHTLNTPRGMREAERERERRRGRGRKGHRKKNALATRYRPVETTRGHSEKSLPLPSGRGPDDFPAPCSSVKRVALPRRRSTVSPGLFVCLCCAVVSGAESVICSFGCTGFAGIYPSCSSDKLTSPHRSTTDPKGPKRDRSRVQGTSRVCVCVCVCVF